MRKPAVSALTLAFTRWAEVQSEQRQHRDVNAAVAEHQSARFESAIRAAVAAEMHGLQ